MFQAGELLVYGSTGVCRVEEITELDHTVRDRGRRYYVLKPLWQDGVIYAPVDSEKVPMRPVISREEAEALGIRAGAQIVPESPCTPVGPDGDYMVTRAADCRASAPSSWRRCWS